MNPRHLCDGRIVSHHDMDRTPPPESGRVLYRVRMRILFWRQIAKHLIPTGDRCTEENLPTRGSPQLRAIGGATGTGASQPSRRPLGSQRTTWLQSGRMAYEDTHPLVVRGLYVASTDYLRLALALWPGRADATFRINVLHRSAITCGKAG